jgi:hypothetical protein
VGSDSSFQSEWRLQETAHLSQKYHAMDITTCPLAEGSNKLVSVFGAWPTFRDASIVYARVDRSGPTVTIAFELTEWTDNHPDEKVNVTIRWSEVTDFSLSGIDPNPAIAGLGITATDTTVKTTLRRGRGPHGSIVAGRLRVLDVVIVEA